MERDTILPCTGPVLNTYVAPGQHLLIDLHDAKNLRDQELIDRALRDAAAACGATVLDIKLHSFGEGAGITGVAILAESHISIHTWPETGFAAIDIFMCGSCDPHRAMPVLEAAFLPGHTNISAHERGKGLG